MRRLRDRLWTWFIWTFIAVKPTRKRIEEGKHEW